MLCIEVTAVGSENYTKHIHALYAQIIEFFNIKPGGK